MKLSNLPISSSDNAAVNGCLLHLWAPTGNDFSPVGCVIIRVPRTNLCCSTSQTLPGEVAEPASGPNRARLRHVWWDGLSANAQSEWMKPLIKPGKTSSLSPTKAKCDHTCALRNPGSAHPHTLRLVKQHPHRHVFSLMLNTSLAVIAICGMQKYRDTR